ncbi:MAG: protein translocase subunit SecF [Holophagales bacterium]|nr:protein translocase subunit SecF [Holophagales bacterium]
MQFLIDSQIPFMKYRKAVVWVSITLLVVAVVELFALGGLNFGIDFKGGTQLTLKMRDAVGVDDLRNALSSAGLREAQIQRYGESGDNEVLIKTPVKEGSEEGTSEEVIAALDATFNPEASDDPQGALDLNRRGREQLSTLLRGSDPDGKGADDLEAAEDHYLAVASALVEQRDRLSIFTSFEQVRAVQGLSPEAAQVLEEKTFLGAFQVLANENVGPQIGSELRTKGYLAVTFSLLAMLAYIWGRFELRFGIGALVAVFHDFLITLGLYALIDFELNLSTIAAFLTLVGYSVNDTVVVFDRVRENMRRFKRRPLEEIMDLSINQTLSRTLLTSGTTLLVVACLFIAGGEVLRGFAFVLMIGILVGTYSSIFVASPFALLWEELAGSKNADAKPRKQATV